METINISLINVVFGPVPSRRLGRSLGVNNIPPPKTCSYSCIYCQLGRTRNLLVQRRSYYDARVLARTVQERLENLTADIDYITFVPDGEPTLDIALEKEVRLIRNFSNTPIAILTNSSLIFREDVRRDLLEFDLVSIKLDTGSERVWRRINRPHPALSFEKILEGMKAFRKEFSGKIISETMLVKEVNVDESELEEISERISVIEPDKAYLSIPIRPPAESWVAPPSEEKIIEAYERFAEVLGKHRVELLTGYEGAGFELAVDPAESILNITAVHPMKLDYAWQALSEIVQDPGKIIDELLASGKLKLINYRGESFLIRRLVKSDSVQT